MPFQNRPSRREVLRWGAVAASGAMLGRAGLPALAADESKPATKLPTRKLGKNGPEICALMYGGGSIARSKEFDEGVQVIAHAIESGITALDSAKNYRSEPHIGKAIEGRRKGLFLATKTGSRDYDGAMRDLEDSLKSFGTDHLELWQVHGLGNPRHGDREIEQLLAADGVMKAMRKMKEEGTVDLIGFSSHSDPKAVCKILETDGIDFDTMLIVLGAAVSNNEGNAWEKEVLPAGLKKGMGVIAMKLIGAGRALSNKDEKVKPDELYKYVWDLGVPCANVGLNSQSDVDTAVAACLAHAKPKERPGSGGEKDTPHDEWCADLRRRLAGIDLPFQHPDYIDGASRTWA